MTKIQIRRIILPSAIGQIIALLLLRAYQALTTWLYVPPDFDDPISLDGLFLYGSIAIFVPALLLTGCFQFFVALPIWETHKRGNKLFGLPLWLLIFISSAVFGVCFVALFGDTRTIGFYNKPLAITATIFIVISYWLSNMWTLQWIDKKEIDDSVF